MRNTTGSDLMNNNFNALLNKFDEAKTEKQWNEIIEEAGSKLVLSSRQREAIIARCENSKAGTFGKTKLPSNFGHSKSN